jgi:hypothetical protein
VDGKTSHDENSVFSLCDAQDIVVRPCEQAETEYYAKNGHLTILATSTSPPVTELEVRRPHGEANFLLFTNANLADCAAKALTHAVELRGGGNKDPFPSFEFSGST